MSSTPALDANGTLYFGGWDSVVYAVDAGTGTGLWQFTQPTAAIKGSPAITANGTIVVGSLDGHVYGISGE